MMQHYLNTQKLFKRIKKQNYNESEIIYPKLNLGDVVFHHCNVIHVLKLIIQIKTGMQLQ